MVSSNGWHLHLFFSHFGSLSSCGIIPCIYRAEEVKEHAFFAGIDWQLVYLQKYPPPLIPPRGEVNAADAFDIGSFDEEDTKGIKLTEADQELYKNFPVTISERWQQEIAETVFDAVNQETDKIEAKKKAKIKMRFEDEKESDCILHGYIKKLGGPFASAWQTRYAKLYPNRLELHSDSGSGKPDVSSTHPRISIWLDPPPPPPHNPLGPPLRLSLMDSPSLFLIRVHSLSPPPSHINPSPFIHSCHEPNLTNIFPFSLSLSSPYSFSCPTMYGLALHFGLEFVRTVNPLGLFMPLHGRVVGPSLSAPIQSNRTLSIYLLIPSTVPRSIFHKIVISSP